jgi:CheY-like chemotaxis protein
VAFKILLADDSVTAQNQAKKILTDAGYDVVAVSNGAAAMKKVGIERPDLLILDIYMPGYTGLEVCEKIKGAPETASTPVLLTVAPMEPYNAADGNRVRADGMILKPFEERDLISAVERLQQQITLRQAAHTPPLPPAKSELQQADDPQDQELESVAEDRRPAAMPELPTEMAASPAFGVEQFDETPVASSGEGAMEFAMVASPVADSSGESFGSMEIMEAELLSQPLKEFNLIAQGFSRTGVAGGDFSSTANSSPSFEDFISGDNSDDEGNASAFQADLESDAVNSSLGELGYAAGLSPQDEMASPVDLDLTPEAGPAEVSGNGGDGEALPDQDPELMVDRTQMIEFATRFLSDAEEEAPLIWASSSEMEQAHVMEVEPEASAKIAAAPGLSIEAAPPEASPEENPQDDGAGEHQFEHSQLEAGMDSIASAELENAASSTIGPAEKEPTLEAEVEQAMAQLPELASESLEYINTEAASAEVVSEAPLSEREEQESVPQSMAQEASSQEQHMNAEQSQPAHQDADGEWGEDEEQRNAPVPPISTGAFFQADEQLAVSLTPAAQPDPSTTSTEMDEDVLEQAVARALERLRPQILSELVRELAHYRE